MWSLARSVPERVVLSDTFLTRHLVSAQTAERPFWVLSVAADRVTLWGGGPDRVAEERTGGFPLVREESNFDPERLMRVGDQPGNYRDEDTRRFLKEAANRLNSLMRTHPRPLYITGEPAALSLLCEFGGACKDAVQVPRGGLAHGTPEMVWQAVRPVLEEEDRRRAEEVARELEAARSRKEFAAGVDELWQSAREGRIRLLAVEENYRITVRDDGEHLIVAQDGDLDAREDIVDEIVEQCLDTGAEVRFVPDGALEDAQGMAAVLRY